MQYKLKTEMHKVKRTCKHTENIKISTKETNISVTK